MSFTFSTHTLSRCCSMYCFHPPGCPTYGNNTLYSQWKYCGWIFALLTSGCTVTSWLPLCFMCEITAPWDCTEKKPITQQMSTFSSEVVRFFFLASPLFLPCAASPVLGDRKRLERRKSFLVIYSWILHLIFMPFSGLSGCRGEFAASEAAEAKSEKKKKSGFSFNEPSGWRKERGREIDG